MPNFLFEIGTEELPARMCRQLIDNMQQTFTEILTQNKIHFTETKSYVTPRRLAVLFYNLPEKQPDQLIERKGPAVAQAYDADGNPNNKAFGFAKSCGVTVNELTQQQIGDQRYLVFKQQKAGAATIELLPDLIIQAVQKMKLPKTMRWGAGEIEFVRPVQWIVALLDEKIIPVTLFGKKSGRDTHGHRFHTTAPITIDRAEHYEEILLEQGKVIADIEKRKQKIDQQIHHAARTEKAQLIEDAELLEEATGLVEWPEVLIIDFDQRFLALPREVLLTSMKVHQRSFGLENSTHSLINKFLVVANLTSQDVAKMRAGYAKVMGARLNDAAFFYQEDLKHGLKYYREKLHGVLLHQKLGDLYQQADRISKLAAKIATYVITEKSEQKKLLPAIQRAGLLSKADLATQMVNEFPELQGIIGHYYALNNLEKREDFEVAKAIGQHYLPRFTGDYLPQTEVGHCIALAEKLDKLVGFFAVGEMPTASKDPFALRRAALGFLRICIEKKINLSIEKLIQQSLTLYKTMLSSKTSSANKHKDTNLENLASELKSFFLERLRAWCLEQNISAEVFNAVSACGFDDPYDFYQRLLAVQKFLTLPEALQLAEANKRVKNILQKNVASNSLELKQKILKESAEINLYQDLIKQQKQLKKEKNYFNILQHLAALAKPLDQFFVEVLVVVEDKKVKTNRLALLNEMRKMFLTVADISYLSP